MTEGQERTEVRAIHWRLHLNFPPTSVYRYLATNEGRARSWAESGTERDGVIAWRFPNRLTGCS